MSAAGESEEVRSDGASTNGDAPAEHVAASGEIPDAFLRPALELAFAVAVAGSRLRPPVAAPASLKRFLKFQKLPGGALPVVRRAIEEDDEFRARAAGIASVEMAGEIGSRWLTRDDGWEEEVASLVAAAEADERTTDDARVERSATRRRDAAEHAAVRARAELAAVQEDIAREREKRKAAEEAVAAATRRVTELEAQLAEQRFETRRARDQGDAARTTLESLKADHTGAIERINDLEQRVDREIAGRVDAQRRMEELNATSAVAAPIEGPDALDPRRVAGALASLEGAAGGLRELARALETTAAAFAGGTSPTDADRPVARGPARDAGPPSSRRRPLAIPGGLLGDSADVALHLVKQPDVTLVVDGYNVAKLGWPELRLADQRDRLLDVLEDLVRRIGVSTVVVFDGADVSCPPTGRRLVRVRFTPRGVLADDEIRDLASRILPADQPVVVATNDQEVVKGVRSSGANVINSESLLAISRR